MPAVLGAGEPDRLDRFRQLARTRLSLAQLGVAGPAEAYTELVGLLDEEIVESLAAGGVFASTAFLQDRLDAFAESWGGASLRVQRLGDLAVGAFHLGDGPGGNTVRVYGRVGADAGLLAALSRDGRPTVHPSPSGPGGSAQFVVAWEGPSSGHGSRALRLDLVRREGEDVRVVWSTADRYAQGLFVRAYRVRGDEIGLRYELRYPGWTPGCEGQTEEEEVLRLAAPAGTFVRRSRHEYNGWHRDLHRSVMRLFEAIADGDRTALASLVPDRGLRERLPATLRGEPACDAADGSNPAIVSVAATGERRPWQLTFRRHGRLWRLVAAAPVLQ